MRRAGIECNIGLRTAGSVLWLDPCTPKTWQHFEMTVRFRSLHYVIFVENPAVENPAGVCRGIVTVTADGTAVLEWPLGLQKLDDGITHHVVVLG
jgi:cyclic beta-1,2-glucan synthetase